MKAYVVVQERVDDEAVFAAYRKEVLPTVSAHGGRFVVRGGKLSIVEGEWKLPRLAIIEFPSRDKAEAWYRSPEYQKVLPLRLKSSIGNLVIVDGAE
ncbi:MAG: DUF1330 domain-containing protein [Alphaproteobacteria bacterium]|nr:DUF1330 domain-containing protein [Alphaproteobacteria bacterium]